MLLRQKSQGSDFVIGLVVVEFLCRSVEFFNLNNVKNGERISPLGKQSLIPHLKHRTYFDSLNLSSFTPALSCVT